MSRESGTAVAGSANAIPLTIPVEVIEVNAEPMLQRVALRE